MEVLHGLATQSKAQMKSKFLEIETSVKLNKIIFSPVQINVAVAGNQYWNLNMSVSKKKSKMCRHSF